MRTDRCSLRAALLAAAALSFSGCLEHTVRTTVREDGSCERVISVTAEKGRRPTTPFPLPRDASWTVTWEPKPGDSAAWLYVARKRFPDCDSLNREYAKPQTRGYEQVDLLATADSSKYRSNGGDMRLEVKIEKRWRWFYTYYRYREVYPVKTAYTMVRPEEVLTENEIRRISRGEDNDTLKRRYDAWVMRNLFSYYLMALEAQVSDLHDSSFTREMLAAKKHELLLAMTGERGGGPARDIEEVLAGYLAGADAKAKPFASDTLTPAGARAMSALLQSVYGPAAARVPGRSLRFAFLAPREMTSATNVEGSFTNIVELPGLLLSTDAAEVQGSSATWRFEMEQLSMRPYVMTAESRTVNTAAFVATGAVALVAFALVALRLAGRFPGAARRTAPPSGEAASPAPGADDLPS